MKYAFVSWVLFLSAAASAATVDVQVRGASGSPLADAVVMIDSPRAPAGPIHFPWPLVVAQQNIAFDPHVLIVPVGAAVAFPNLDRVRHHVYSFSTAKPFELKLYGRQQERTVTFDKPGAIALGCNIHDRMSGFIMVVKTPYAARTDASGKVSIAQVPAGSAVLRVWHPQQRSRDNQVTAAITVPASGTMSRDVAMTLR